MTREKQKAYIIGPRGMQNEIIAAFLADDLDVKCILENEIADLFSPAREPCRVPRLILCDCEALHFADILALLQKSGMGGCRRDYVVLFNLPADASMEDKYVARGVRGLFYRRDSLERFQKGLRAIIDGELWLSRQAMTRFILGRNGSMAGSSESRPSLTRRETEILAFVSTGASNDEIADQLCVSAHTVKTHLYNIYKKINVANRLQASLWATKHL